MNKEITTMLESRLGGLTLSTDHGKFLADKSYGFDTMFFVCRFIQRFRNGDIYRKHDLNAKSNAYIRDLFCLREASQVGNYFTEGIALLVFCGILEQKSRGVYRILDNDLLEFIGSSFENAYVFMYMLCYCVFRHDELWEEYRKFCRARTLAQKQTIYMRIREIFIRKDRRILDPKKEWANFVPKYPMVVLNFANRQNMVSRTTRVRDEPVTVRDISLNTKGTRANSDLPKKNAYLDDLSFSYITETLRPYLISRPPKTDTISGPDGFSVDVADTKLDMLDTEGLTAEMRRKMQQGKYRLSSRGTQTRTVQGVFKSALLQKTPHRCPICGFDFGNLLIASHIVPYAKCEDTYDAMNPYNGLLLCPTCDRLFESGNYITIDCRSGEVIYAPELERFETLGYLHERRIDPNYILCERKHYLARHNAIYREKHENRMPE
ncbi:HNH endonuclease [Alistipes sp.]|uniref:HNH endonuclease n=1 Tax=Alistipes sp. TaxID=1872444 RepID=UPI003AF03DEF